MRLRLDAIVFTLVISLIICLPHSSYANEGQKILGGYGKLFSALGWIIVGIGILWVAVQVGKNMDQNDEQ
ncbi:hypothetical protein LJ737_22485 [Hymenobacter sp. 15J16-1T3B]|uniref:hypothetical protein n=1 Tax=Hymenobacter sp. 15J16-1T3B TaxID=2886941 RepID=UPI001D1154F7|nr:hypothetical protein [Hymenobacter sp. 15J16-1T3B]MCC3160022.1 hypothetical protein [Hymenobacter sp. 15J16-1T3B]